jgi:hypothetical protein
LCWSSQQFSPTRARDRPSPLLRASEEIAISVTWVVDRTGRETAHCCFNAVLRDWARFALLGIHGQAIFVDPGAQLVHTAVRLKPTADSTAAESIALWRAVVKRYVD